MATSCTIDFTNVETATFNGTNLSEIWVCNTSNATCRKVWPMGNLTIDFNGILNSSSNTTLCKYTQASNMTIETLLSVPTGYSGYVANRCAQCSPNVWFSSMHTLCPIGSYTVHNNLMCYPDSSLTLCVCLIARTSGCVLGYLQPDNYDSASCGNAYFREGATSYATITCGVTTCTVETTFRTLGVVSYYFSNMCCGCSCPLNGLNVFVGNNSKRASGCFVCGVTDGGSTIHLGPFDYVAGCVVVFCTETNCIVRRLYKNGDLSTGLVSFNYGELF